MLADKEDLTKGKSCMVLGKIGKPAIPALLAALSHTNDIARALAAVALGEIRNERYPLPAPTWRPC